MDYLKALQYIAHVDSNDTVLGKVERWEAHEKGILHRAFTLSIMFEDTLVLQHRKHPVFDGIYDVSISSHPLYVDDTLQDPLDAIYRTLAREWHIEQPQLVGPPEYKGKIYYQAADPYSRYQEHEICYIYTCELKKIIMPNFETAYGFSLQTPKQLRNPKNPLTPLLAPWVKKMIEENLL